MAWGRKKVEPQTSGYRSKMPSDTPGTKTITAAATVLGLNPNEKAGGRNPHHNRIWQEEVFGYYDTVGELHNACNYIANAMSRIRLRPGWEDDDGNIVPLDDKTKGVPQQAKTLGKTVEMQLRNLRARSGGQKRILFRLGLNLTLAAECYLVHTDVVVGGKVQARQWEVLSVDELRVKPSDNIKNGKNEGPGYIRYPGPGWAPIDLDPDSHPVRIWLDHPRYSQLADSSIHPLLDILEEIVLLRREVRGQTLSQLAGPGVLLWPQEMDWPNDPTVPESEAGQPMQYLLGQAMGAAIADKGSPNAQIPLLVEMPSELIKEVRHIDFRAAADSLQVTKRQEALEAFARGAPLPVEITTGHMSTTFANAGQIDEDTYKAYIEPFAEGAIDSVVVGYIHPQLMIAEGLDPGSIPPEVIQRMSIFPDLQDLLAPMDEVQQTIDAWDRYLINDEAGRRKLGFGEDDKPSDDEVMARVRVKQMGNSRETLRGMVSTSAEDSLIAPDPNASTDRPPMSELPPPDSNLPSKKPVDPDKREDDPVPPAVPVPGAPPTQEVDVSGVPTPVPAAAAEGGTQASGARMLSFQVQSAVEMAVARAMDRAGARLKQKSNGQTTAEFAKKLAQADKHVIPSLFGAQHVSKLIPFAELFGGEFDALARTVTTWATTAAHPDPSGVGDRAMALAETLARARVDDPALAATPEQIARCITGQ